MTDGLGPTLKVRAIDSSAVEDATRTVDPCSDDPARVGDATIVTLTSSAGTAPPRALPRMSPGRLRRRAYTLSIDARRELLWITVVYLSARILLLLAAVLLDAFGHRPLQAELANWDGTWYRAAALHGYPQQISHGQSTLGFFPLYPIAIHLVSPIVQVLTGTGQISSATNAGVLISWVGGLVTTVFVHRLAEGWWDRATARRATVVFVVFPGAVVFSMVYSEALLLPLAAVCIWALERRRWVLAGVMAGLGTAVNPVGLLLGLVCGVCALRELWRHGPRSREFAMSLLASVMSATGAVAFLSFLWAWTGNPFATYIAQARGWGHTSPSALALVHGAERIVPAVNPSHHYPQLDLNYVVSTVGAVLMLYELWLLWRSRRELSLPAIVWTLGVTCFMAITVPPTPRLLITAFPMLVLLARWTRPKHFPVLVAVNVILLVGLSLLTFYLHVLRP